MRDAVGAGGGLQKAIAAKALAAPGRALTFIWGDENGASRAWLTAHPEPAKGMQCSRMDMTGARTPAKIGGTFLIEKQPDPSAVWPPPWIRTRLGRERGKSVGLKGTS